MCRTAPFSCYSLRVVCLCYGRRLWFVVTVGAGLLWSIMEIEGKLSGSAVLVITLLTFIASVSCSFNRLVIPLCFCPLPFEGEEVHLDAGVNRSNAGAGAALCETELMALQRSAEIQRALFLLFFVWPVCLNDARHTGDGKYTFIHNNSRRYLHLFRSSKTFLSGWTRKMQKGKG